MRGESTLIKLSSVFPMSSTKRQIIECVLDNKKFFRAGDVAQGQSAYLVYTRPWVWSITES
jgi:hypothetical protein